MSSCAGYHTPIEDEVAGDGISDLPSDLGLLTSRGGSFLHTQVENISMHFIMLLWCDREFDENTLMDFRHRHQAQQ